MTNREVAEMLQVSLSNIISAARRLGLEKGVKRTRALREEHIQRNFLSKSLQSLAKDLSISKTTVSRIAASLGLTRTRDEMRDFNSSQRIILVKRERRRIIFGLDPVSGIKVVSNRKRITLRYRLKRKGYIPSDDRNVMYYPESILRARSQEIFGESLGLKFKPLPI